MHKSLIVFDLDHTLVTLNSSYAFGKYLYSKSFLSTADMLYMTGCYAWHKCGQMSLEDVHHYIFRRFFKGKSLAAIEEHAQVFLNQQFEGFQNPVVCRRLAEAQQRGDHVFLLSSSPQFIVSPIAERLGIGHWEGSYYGVDKDYCLCQISKLIDGEAKAHSIFLLAKQLEVERAAITVYTDSSLDLPLQKVAGKFVGVNPDRRLRRECLRQGWEVI